MTTNETSLDQHQDVQCSDNHKGIICGLCKDGFVLDGNGLCAPCSSAPDVALAVSIFLVLNFCLAVFVGGAWFVTIQHKMVSILVDGRHVHVSLGAYLGVFLCTALRLVVLF